MNPTRTVGRQAKRHPTPMHCCVKPWDFPSFLSRMFLNTAQHSKKQNILHGYVREQRQQHVAKFNVLERTYNNCNGLAGRSRSDRTMRRVHRKPNTNERTCTRPHEHNKRTCAHREPQRNKTQRKKKEQKKNKKKDKQTTNKTKRNKERTLTPNPFRSSGRRSTTLCGGLSVDRTNGSPPMEQCCTLPGGR